MKLERTLYQRSHYYFIGFSVFVLSGFWLSYFTELLNQENYRMHLHGMVMIAWCFILMLQPYLIRTKRLALHRKVGKFTFLLVPLVAISTVDLYKYRLSELTVLAKRDYLFSASVLIALLTFLIFYGLAIWFRKKPGIHARFMVCTVFAMFTAVFDRIILYYLPSLLPYFPDVEGPVVQVVGLTLGDILLFGLCMWDWRSHRRINVFPVALVIHLGYHFAVLNFYKYPFWQSFSNWFFEL